MKRMVFVVMLLAALCAGCAPRVSKIDEAYRQGRLTEYEYRQLKLQERLLEEQETQTAIQIMNSGRRR